MLLSDEIYKSYVKNWIDSITLAVIKLQLAVLS